MLFRSRIAAELGVQTQHPSLRFFQRLHIEGLHAVSRLGLNHTLRVFCLPGMPRLYLDMLKQLSSWIDIDIYAINPCSEYWYDIVNPKRLSKLLTVGREEAKEQWASGAFTDQSHFATAILNAKAVGKCEMISRIHDISFTDIEFTEE